MSFIDYISGIALGLLGFSIFYHMSENVPLLIKLLVFLASLLLGIAIAEKVLGKVGISLDGRGCTCGGNFRDAEDGGKYYYKCDKCGKIRGKQKCDKVGVGIHTKLRNFLDIIILPLSTVKKLVLMNIYLK